MATTSVSNTAPARATGVEPNLIWHALGATRRAALAAAALAGRGDGHGADAAATDALRRALAGAPARGVVISGEGAKDAAPMLADGEPLGTGEGEPFEMAVDPLECTDLCASGLPGAITTLALAPRGALWRPGPAFYMEKLVGARALRDAVEITDPPELIVERAARALGRAASELRVIVLDKPRHRELIARLRSTGASVSTPPAGDVAGALSVAMGTADLLLGVGGAPEGLLAACAVAALGGTMQARLAPQREDERVALRREGRSTEAVIGLAELVRAPAVFLATGVSGGLLAAPRRTAEGIETTSLLISKGSIQWIRSIEHGGR
jgi:fructose-1,6-bisphosphatase II